MTITTNDDRDEYTATAGQTVFSYTFRIYADTDLNVYQTPSSRDFDDASDLITAYTVSGVNDPNGGSITLTTGAANGDRITIVSAIPTNRTTDYVVSGDFTAATVNQDIDRTVSLVKQVEGMANRALLFPESEQGATGKTIATPVGSEFLRWNAAGTEVESVDLLSSGVNVSFVGTTREFAIATQGQTVFSLSGVYEPGINAIDVYVNGVNQTGQYSETSSSSITFITGLDAGDRVDFIINQRPNSGTTTAASNITYGTSNVQTFLDRLAVTDYTQLRGLNTSTLANGDTVTVTNDGIAGDFVLRNSAAHGLTDNGGTIIVINTDWYAERVFEGGADPLWFGADATGAADSSAAIQAALDNYEWVAFSEGTYKVETELDPPSNRVITGNRTKIEAGVNLQIASAQAFIFRLTANGITFRDLIMNVDYSIFPRNASDEAKVGAVYGSGRNNIVFDNCTIAGGANYFQASGFIATGLIEFTNSAYLRFNDCFVRGDYSSAWSGSAAQTEICKISTSTDVTINGGVYRGSFYSCIAFGIGCERVIVDGVQCDTCIGSVVSFNASDSVLSNSILKGSRDEGGVAMGHPSSGSEQSRVIGNLIIDCGRSGVNVAYADSIIANNTIINCDTDSPTDVYAAGIAIGDAQNPTTSRPRASITGNIVRNCYNGIVVSDSSIAGVDGSDYTITGNTVTNNTNVGIYSQAPNVTITGNVSRGNNVNIQIETTRSTDNLVTANCIVDGTTFGILASTTGAGTMIYGNTDQNNTANSISVDGIPKFWNSRIALGDNGVEIIEGTGSPETNITAQIGSIYLRENGGASTTLYVKESGTGNTGWVAK